MLSCVLKPEIVPGLLKKVTALGWASNLWQVLKLLCFQNPLQMFWLWSPVFPRDSVAMLRALIFQDEVFKTCVTIVYAKKSLELTAGLQMGSHNGACIGRQAFADNQGQCCVWPRALEGSLLKGCASPTLLLSPSAAHLRLKLTFSKLLPSALVLRDPVLSSNARKWLPGQTAELTRSKALTIAQI